MSPGGEQSKALAVVVLFPSVLAAFLVMRIAEWLARTICYVWAGRARAGIWR
ncbi:hypothetical protein CC78DRAFT_537562 [Lojkania enalia]|uniref:Uncharacterized protein n=1 Tax=Lojkania enalia TaxID=147567 RepID=A0A9P4K3E3_9PLEO|nr:hypothetical protein CC78DRAFT_537562 [Didymosphaeria enalia]